jgi:hypothetical protein
MQVVFLGATKGEKLFTCLFFHFIKAFLVGEPCATGGISGFHSMKDPIIDN